jgi:hypothetical protein
MIVHLRSRRLCRLTMNTQTKPTLTIEKSKYMNQMDEHLELFAVLFLLKSSFPYPLVKPPMNPRPPWKKFLANMTRRGDICLRWNCSLCIQKPSTISKISLSNIKICCRNSRLAGLINLRRRNKCFLPFSPNLVQNTPCLYPHFIQLGSPLEPPG